MWDFLPKISPQLNMFMYKDLFIMCEIKEKKTVIKTINNNNNNDNTVIVLKQIILF